MPAECIQCIALVSKEDSEDSMVQRTVILLACGMDATDKYDISDVDVAKAG